MAPTIALAMIVRDEAEVIGRCLESVRGEIDYWVICDTGSSDGTQEIVRDALAGILGELHERAWVDFGHNRTELLGLARGRADYLLLLDADMTMRIRGKLPRLSADSYMLRFDEDPEYWLECLVRGDRRWWSEGSTHEHIATDAPRTVQNLNEIVVEHHHDGSSRPRKLSRDRELLEKDLGSEPENPRTIFYLAQTYRDLGELDRALELYARRTELGGWEEEVFYALYQCGVLRARRGEWPWAMTALIAAWEYRPTRVEPLYELTSGLRRRGEFHTAYLFAKQGLGASPSTDQLFVERWIYEWGLLFEYSIASFWAGDPHAALRACDGLLDRGRLPEAYRRQTIENREYCLEALTPEAGSDPTFSLTDGRSVEVHIPDLPAAG